MRPLGELSTIFTKGLPMLYDDPMNQKNENMPNKVIHEGLLPAGNYYVGDLCYVISDNEWTEYCERSFPNDSEGEHVGFFENSARVGYANFGTKYGDGEYLDESGRSYSVDSGSIGCIPVGALSDKYDLETLKKLGNFIEFTEPFECEYDEEAGTICFGEITIETGDYEEEEYDYDNDEEDEE